MTLSGAAKTSSSPYQIQVNKGEVVVQQTGEEKVAYRILEPKDSGLIRVEQRPSSLNFFATDTVEKFRVEVSVPKGTPLDITLQNGALELQRLQNPVKARVDHGNVHILSYEHPSGNYTAETVLTAGTILYETAKKVAGTISAKVEIGTIDNRVACKSNKASSLGHTGKQLELVCGDKKERRYQATLQVTHGTIQIQ